MDNDAAGYQAVWRTLEREIGNMTFPPLDPDGMGLLTYKTWLQDIIEWNPYPVSDLLWELKRLKEKDNAEDIDKVEALNKAFTLCQINQQRSRYLAALRD
jgi:hypothetical protein